MIIEAGGLTVRYGAGRNPALNDASCTLAEGQLIAVVGPNGSGKTTLLRALLGMAPLERGRVNILGKDINRWRRRDLARVLGVVAQREEMVYPLRVDETVMLGRYAFVGALAPLRKEDEAAVESALALCDIQELRSRRTDTLSGGEWQRVRVARALAQEPRALLLDEPTAALDIRHEMEVFELVHQLVGKGIGALVVTHHINLAARYAGHMILLSDGKIVAEGTPHEVLHREVLEQVFAWPVAITASTDGAPQLEPLRFHGVPR